MILKKGLIIGYFTLLESVVKVYVSDVVLVWVAVFPDSADFLNKSCELKFVIRGIV